MTEPAESPANHCPVCHKNLRVTSTDDHVTEASVTYCSAVCRDLALERAARGEPASEPQRRLRPARR